jgi:hypothetical protein
MKSVGFLSTCAAMVEEFLRYLTPSPGRLPRGIAPSRAANEAFAAAHLRWPGSEALSA